MRRGGSRVDVRAGVRRGRQDRYPAQDLRAVGRAAVPGRLRRNLRVLHARADRARLAARWGVLLFLPAYGDIFGFFKPGQIEDVVSGEISGIKITDGFLFAVSVYLAIRSVMALLPLGL